ncbi:hypothetical protein MA16_Dca029102 [Dendrobium catenatum]|uniref:Uncharacterized protein n=1 Tax=Dendrobium catenatum TaxID=906689 RepID=A0A2I0V9R9_9ASPA|nr:hypothetical protein MA16_Dca029102 [Dendrobium catenatum]
MFSCLCTASVRMDNSCIEPFSSKKSSATVIKIAHFAASFLESVSKGRQVEEAMAK